MSFGARARALLGPLEEPVARLYRGFFFDPRTLAAELARRCRPANVLEIGCGEGLLTDVLAGVFPDAWFTGIDIAGTPGRLYGRDHSRATFRLETAAALADRAPGTFDLVVISDVMHHVPPGARATLLEDAARAARPGGWLLVKDWERRSNIVHALNWFSDRVISGAIVRYETADEMHGLITRALAGALVSAPFRLRPWINNFAVLVRLAG